MMCKCGASGRARAKHFFRRTVAGTTFVAAADVDSCGGCGEVRIPASLMIAFERAIACELARRGPISDETFRWIRRAASIERGDLAQLLGVTAETIAGWEAERRPIDRAAWLLLAAIVLDSIEGPRPLRARLRAQQSAAATPPELMIELPPGGMTARVLSLIANGPRWTEREIADALGVDESAVGALVRDLDGRGLILRALDESGTGGVIAGTREGNSLLRAAVDAGVDLDAPLPPPDRAEPQKNDSRHTSISSSWRMTSS
jgi:DNA-binding transcriptional regulator YiaG